MLILKWFYQEHSWNSWLETSTKLDVFKDYKSVSKGELNDVETDELNLVRNLYSVVLSYYLHSVRGCWHQLEATANFFLFKLEQVGCCLILSLFNLYDQLGGVCYFAWMMMLRFMTMQGQLSSLDSLWDIFDDIAGSLLQKSVKDNIFLFQPCCDNVLHFLNLIHELLVNQMGIKLLVCF